MRLTIELLLGTRWPVLAALDSIRCHLGIEKVSFYVSVTINFLLSEWFPSSLGFIISRRPDEVFNPWCFHLALDFVKTSFCLARRLPAIEEDAELSCMEVKVSLLHPPQVEQRRFPWKVTKGLNRKGEGLTSTIFQGRAVKLRGCILMNFSHLCNHHSHCDLYRHRCKFVM